MTPTKARRSRLALALGALALLAMPGLAVAKDSNHDRIPDRWEKRHKLSLEVNQAKRDQDHDQLRNRAEFLAGDNPKDADSDDDGVTDGDEQAGTIASFNEGTGRLVIDLFGADTVAGFVTDATEIKCEDEGGAATASSEGEPEPGDDEEPGEDDSGPSDDSGPADEGEDDSGPSENSGPGNENDDDEDRVCTTAALVPGAVVEEAELKIAGGRAVFEEVELSGKEV